MPEGGGAATGIVAVDGALNNVFEDISDLDRAYGRFNLRKLFLAVRSLSTDLYSGSKIAITGLPNDPALGYTLFTTKSSYDTRESARDKVESYLYKSGMWHGAVADNLIVGMKQFTIIQRVGTALPPIGRTLCLVQFEDQPAEIEQYVRVTEVSSVRAIFTDDKGDFERLLVTVTTKDPFRSAFVGHTANRFDTYAYTTGVRLRNTVVANATNYYGAQTIRTAASIGDVRVRAKSMFTALVPAASTETPLINQVMAGQVVSDEDAGGGLTVAVAQTAHTLANAVTEEARRFNWIANLLPHPKPGTLNVAFMSQGNWYELTDDGAGVIAGEDDGIGSGTVVYASGLATITLGALPDAGSQILWTWASPVHYTIRAGATTDVDPRGARLAFALPNTPVAPTSVVVHFLRNSVALTATTSSGGAISGAGVSGTLNVATGAGELFFALLPDRETAIGIDYNFQAPDAPEAPTERRLSVTMDANKPSILTARSRPGRS